MKIPIPGRLRTEDYSEKDRPLVSKLSEALTPFMDNVYRALNGGIDYENLNQQIVDVVVKTDSTGKVINPPKIKVTIAGRIRGGLVVNSVNLKNPGVFPLSAPFISFTHAEGIVNILNVGGLQPNSEYRLTIQLSA